MKAGVTLRAPAKLNLTLEVLARQNNGLHALRSVMVPVDLFDEILIDRGGGFQFVCNDPDLLSGNLIERALKALGADSDLLVELKKHIPKEAGMGGGSSDAAAILLAAQRGLLPVSPAPDFLGLARSLGSDVPFFLVETAALVEGTGERVTALGSAPPWYAVVIIPPASISTSKAYEWLAQTARPSRPRNSSVSIAMGEALQRAQFESVIELLQNDFHDVLAARVPEVARSIEILQNAGAQRPLLTGSGSCVFALMQSARERDDLMRRLDVPGGYKVFGCAFWHGEAWRSAA